MALTLLSGCVSPGGSTGTVDTAGTGSITPGITAAQPTRSGDLVVLRRAMLPREEPQSIYLDLRETRDTSGEGFAPTHHELHLELTGTLLGEPSRDLEAIRARLVLEHITLEYSAPGKPGETFKYESGRDSADGDKALADLMDVVARAEISLTISPTGRLIECDGLDPLWRKANLLMAPPALLTAQWLFRDIGMCELLSEALFPPMPSESVRAGERFGVKLPVNIMLAAPLVSELSGTLVRANRDLQSGETAEVELTGTIRPDDATSSDERPGLIPVVRSSSHEVSQRIAPEARGLEQESRRSVEVALTLQPPSGNERREMIIHQTRLLVSRRGPDL